MTTTDPDQRSGQRSFDAVLCDIDNVIRHYDHAELARLERAAGLAPGATAAVAFAPEVITPLILGQVTKPRWRASVARALTGKVPAEVAAGLAAALAQAPTRADEAVVGMLQRAQARMPVVLVTNGSTELDEELALLELPRFSGSIVNSAAVGFAKPDRRIYALAAERAGVAPERCLFVDDRWENVEAAVALGMSGVHYRRPADLGEALSRLPAG